MPPTRVVDPTVQQAKRRLRSDIARSRRQIDGAVGRLAGERQRLTSWQTYVRRFPLAALGLSLGAGITLSAAGSRRRLWRLFGPSLTNWALGTVRAGLWNDVVSLWDRPPTDARRPD